VCARAQDAGAEVDLILSRDLMFPIYDTETPERDPRAQRFVAAVRAADALIVASPGYHGAMSGMIKNALDYLEDTNKDDRVYLDGIAGRLCRRGLRLAGDRLHLVESAGHCARNCVAGRHRSGRR